MNNQTPDKFLDIPEKYSDYKTARAVVISVPYEATVSYGCGTKFGPKAIIEASGHVELYDEELGCEPFKMGIATLDELPLDGRKTSEIATVIGPTIAKVIADGKLPVILGGEHSITPAVMGAVKSAHGELTIVQFDAHADLREEYEGDRMSHACAMARAREFCDVVHVGIRNISAEEAELAKREEIKIFYAHRIRENGEWMKEVVEAVQTKKVYITFDVDAFDASVMPATGTPEPGGLFWHQVTELLKLVIAQKSVVGFDFVELAPIKGFHSYDFTVAKLVYKCLGWWWKLSGHQ